MTAIYALAFAVAAGFAVIVVATILVIRGVHHEERRRTLLHGEPPTVSALLARRILGAYVSLRPETLAELDELQPDDLGEEPPWYERPVGPRAR